MKLPLEAAEKIHLAGGVVEDFLDFGGKTLTVVKIKDNGWTEYFMKFNLGERLSRNISDGFTSRNPVISRFMSDRPRVASKEELQTIASETLKKGLFHSAVNGKLNEALEALNKNHPEFKNDIDKVLGNCNLDHINGIAIEENKQRAAAKAKQEARQNSLIYKIFHPFRKK